MSYLYSIEKMSCSLCEEKRGKARHEEQDRVFQGRKPTDEEWKKFYNKWEEEHPTQIKTCFYFIADCGGDQISVCEPCMRGIIQEMRSHEYEQ